MSTCTRTSAALAEPLTATAATARTWLLIEQPGPWGAKALKSSHLDPSVGRALDRLTNGTGVRIGLIRRPGRHADTHRPTRHRVFTAHTAPRNPWVRTAEIADPAELLALDFPALGAGADTGFGSAYDGPPLALVCTNGTRDRCCALHGRPLAAELAGADGHDGGHGSGGGHAVWETTHLGGHRFAPTMLVLPHGYAYGRLDGARAKAVLEAARSGLMVTDRCRGRSAWDRPGQAAELAVRALTGEDRADTLTVEPADGSGPGARSVRVTHTDGRAWLVRVTESVSTPPRPESCGAALGTPARMDVTGIDALPGTASGPPPGARP